MSLSHVNVRDSSSSLMLVPTGSVWFPIVRTMSPVEGSYVALETLNGTIGDAPIVTSNVF